MSHSTVLVRGTKEDSLEGDWLLKRLFWRSKRMVLSRLGPGISFTSDS